MILLSILAILAVRVCIVLSFTDFNDVALSNSKHAPNENEIEAALKKAREINFMKRSISLFDRSLSSDDNSNRVRCPLSLHHGVRQYGDNTRAKRQANDALLAMRILMEEGGYSSVDLQQDTVHNIFKRFIDDTCDRREPGNCSFTSRYRMADGSCNNVQNPGWGMTGSIQERVLPNAYDDKVGLPRTKGLLGRKLPNPRTVSNVVHKNKNLEETLSDRLTLHVMGFGQFLDHDIAITPEGEEYENCCDEAAKDDKESCFNIVIEKSPLETSPIFVPDYCMQLKRSAPVFCPDATSNETLVRQQTNGLTAFVDASNVYGSSLEKQRELRENGNGYRLATSMFESEERILNGPDTGCKLTEPTQSCSLAGDRRVNEIPTLTSYHYLFVKEHNRIAEQIKEYINDEEVIFQETRRIVIAIMQKIVYDEYLPSIFSPEGLQTYRLKSSVDYQYEPDTNPNLMNAFGIAYRVGHSWIPQQIQIFSRSLKQINQEGFSRKTEDVYFNPDMTYMPDGFEGLSYFLTGRQSPETDSVLEEPVRSKLFINEEGTEAFDLAALNIQRARDHGLPSYHEYRRWCGLSPLRSVWGNSGLVDHTSEMAKNLKKAGYRSPQDIDLFVGGLTEIPVEGGNLGPTFECIIGRHFQNLKFGDRFWYQNEDAGFTPDQISAIKAYSLSKVLCNNYNFEKVHHPSAFVSTEQPKSCDEIPDLDVSIFEYHPPSHGELVRMINELEKELEERR